MIPFSPPHIDEKIVQEVSNALLSGWITTGPRTKKLEKEIGLYCNIENVLAVNSWTAGAEMLLRWFGVQEGDELIIPAYTYCATANIIIHCGAIPVMVDIEDDFCISVEKIKEAITNKTKAIIPVDLGGYPCNYDEINTLINSDSIKKLFSPRNSNQEQLGRILVLTDAAHSFGASYNNEKIGAQADFTVFSFHAVKNLTTAEGGAICINLPEPFDNRKLYNNLNTLSLHGQNKDALAKTQKGAWEYDVLEAGFKCNMTDILASIGLVELERYESESLPRRKEIFELYSSKFQEYDWAEIPIYRSESKETSYHLYLLRIKNITLEQRNAIISKIFDKDVAVNVHYKPLPLLTYYKNKGYSIETFPNTKNYWEREITLPVYIGLTNIQVQEVINSVIDSYFEVIN
jgi:dTDP-4-amino-4,6-dideoxygalactose transaminase